MQEEFRAIRPGELEECLDLWGNVFERVGRQYFVPYFHGDPWFKRVYTRVCAVDGKLVSAVQVCERRVRVGGAEIVMGGIGNVGTYPEHRGRGYSTHLMEDTVRVMHDHGMDLSVLFSGIQPFYERVGWRSVPQRMLTGSLRAGRGLGTPGKYSVRQCDWASDLASIQEIYDAFNDGRPLTTVRTPEYWAGYALPRFGAPQFTLAAEDEGTVVGYLHFRYERPDCWLREIGYLPEAADCAESLIRAAADRVQQAGVQRIWVNLPHEPEILAGIERVAERVEPREPMGMMCRIINMPSLGTRMLPELSRRARAGGLASGRISLDAELGSLELTITDDGVSLGAEDPVHIPISQSDFFCLLFGIKSAEELGLPIPAEAGPIISALFPPQRPVFWLNDHV